MRAKRLVERARRLRRLSLPELWQLVDAQLTLVRAQFRVWTHPQGRLVSGAQPGGPTVPLTTAEVARAKAIALDVMRAAEHGLFRPACLVRAVAIQMRLQRRGLPKGQLRIGVRYEEGHFAAHAWVECGELLLGDASWHVSRFVPMAEAQLETEA